MKKKLILLLALTITLIALSGCDESTIDLEELQARLIAANANIDTYDFEIDMDMKTSMMMLGQNMDLDMEMKYTGAIDRPNQKLYMTGVMTSNIMGMNMDIDMDVYLVDGQMYTKTMNQWMREPFDESAWSDQDQIEQSIELIQSGTIALEREARMKGKQYYVVSIKPDLKKLTEIVLQEQELGQLDLDINFEDVIKEYTLTIWVNKQTFIIDRSESYVVMSFTPEDLGEIGDEEIKMVFKSDTTINNVNKPVNIVLPEEAKRAREQPFFY